MSNAIANPPPANNSEELRKHVGAIHVRNTLTLLQHKIANALLLVAYDDLPTSDEHVIKISQLARLAGFDSNDHDLLRDALVALAETSLQWNVLNDGKSEWGVSTMLAQAVLKGSECYYAYSPELRRKLYNPEIYARINLAVQRTFTSGYALKLYENCNRYRETGSTGWWSVEVFRSLMGLTDEYSNFKDLNKCIIKPAMSQVNLTSDILLEIEYKRQDRKIVELRFHLQDNPQLFLRLPNKDQLLSTDDMNATATPVADTTALLSAAPVLEQLQRFGLSAKEATAALRKYGEAYIVENLRVVEESYLAGKVACLPAFTKSALKEDYRSHPLPLAAEDNRQRQDQRKSSEQRQATQQILETLRIQFEKERLETALAGLTADERISLEAEFAENCRHQPLFKKWVGQGLTHPIVQGLFRNFAANRLLTAADEEAFIAYVAARDVLPAD